MLMYIPMVLLLISHSEGNTEEAVKNIDEDELF
jgi:hypothetical protein